MKEQVLMNPYQRLKLAEEILKLIENEYPQGEFEGQDETLALALTALTNVNYARQLLSGK